MVQSHALPSGKQVARPCHLSILVQVHRPYATSRDSYLSVPSRSFAQRRNRYLTVVNSILHVILRLQPCLPTRFRAPRTLRDKPRSRPSSSVRRKLGRLSRAPKDSGKLLSRRLARRRTVLVVLLRRLKTKLLKLRMEPEMQCNRLATKCQKPSTT